MRRKPKTGSELLQARVDSKLVEIIDNLAKRQFRTRSDIIRRAAQGT
jgi:metal-responsive CopG/Arc/MetJ family transcriptional regulator